MLVFPLIGTPQTQAGHVPNGDIFPTFCFSKVCSRPWDRDRLLGSTKECKHLLSDNSPVFRGDDDRDTRSCQLCFFPRELLFRVS